MTKTLEDKIEELLHTREGRHFPEVAKDLGKLFKSEMKKLVPKPKPKPYWNKGHAHRALTRQVWNDCRLEMLKKLREIK